MIPSQQRIRATRRWAAGQALTVGAGVVLLIAAVRPDAVGIALGVAAAAPLAWWLWRRENRIIRQRLRLMKLPFPPAWETYLREHIPYYAALSPTSRERFQHLVRIFIAEKPVVGIGFQIDDDCRLLVAASAVIPIFAFPAWEYLTLRKVLIRPEPFDATFNDRDRAEVMASGMVGAAGLFNGVMILSRPDLLTGFAQGAGKHHVGIHEFAHLIDQNDGAIDGVPASIPRECIRPWTTLVHEHLAGQAGQLAGIPAYGYTNEAEFFAVVSEYFFQSPDELASRDPPLYALLQRIFDQDLRHAHPPPT